MHSLIAFGLCVLGVSATGVQDRRAPAPAGCPATLTPGNYIAPNFAVPVASSHPNTAYGPQQPIISSSGISTIFSFDQPKSFANRNCSLYFIFPTRTQQVNSSYLGAPDAGGSLRFRELWIDPNTDWTYNDVPETRFESGTYAVAPGNAYRIAGSYCAIGRTLGFEISSVGGYNLTWAQSTDKCPMGLFILGDS